MIKNIVFDIGNVLIAWNPDKIAEHYSNNNEEKEILKNVVLQSKEWIELDEGKLSTEQAIEIMEEKLSNDLKGKAKEIVNNWFKIHGIYPTMCKFIKKLKENDYKLYVLSNTSLPVYEYVKESEIGNYFDGFLISCIEKIIKPDEKIYYRFFEKFNLVPEECFFIDDNEKNIVSSEKCGMKGYIFNINNFNSLILELNQNNITL